MTKVYSNNVGEENYKRILVTLEDFTSLRGEELLQNLYLVVIGYNLEKLDLKHKPNPPAVTNGGQIEHYIKTGNNQPSRIIMPTDSEHFIKKQINDRLNNNNTSPIKEFTFDRGNNKLEQTYRVWAGDFFFAWKTPIFLTQRGRKFIPPIGIPLFYGTPRRQASIYTAVLDAGSFTCKSKMDGIWKTLSEKFNKELESRQNAAEAFCKVDHELDKIHKFEFKRIVDIENREKEIRNQFNLIKNEFSKLIKAVELNILEHKQHIRYTNVFTFRENDDWLEGGHKDWGDHRMSMTLNVQVEN